MSYYTIKYGESLIDISSKLYGDISYVYDLLKWNTSINGISDTNIIGLELYYEPIVKSSFKPVVTEPKNIKKNVTISESQSVFDVSLQIYGTIEKAFDLIKLANISDINDTDLAGINFNYDFVGNKVTNYFNNRNLKIATIDKTNLGGWILETGLWDDSKKWKDDKNWID